MSIEGEEQIPTNESNERTERVRSVMQRLEELVIYESIADFMQLGNQDTRHNIAEQKKKLKEELRQLGIEL